MSTKKSKTRKPNVIDVNADLHTNKDNVKSNSKQEILKAKKALQLAKEVEQTKKDHVWLTKGKTSILASPGKIANYLLQGYREMKVKLKRNCKNG